MTAMFIILNQQSSQSQDSGPHSTALQPLCMYIRRPVHTWQVPVVHLSWRQL